MSEGAYSVHLRLRTELENYIKSQYFGKSPVLLNAIGPMLDNEGILYRKPYIESSPAYKSASDGVNEADLPQWLREFFISLADANLGVYKTPYLHQTEALSAAYRGDDLFVSTGTGSGKTECFMWPLIAKLANEARNSKDTWNMRGVRAIILYPMNALVSDQISRLRKLIGGNDNKFVDIFRSFCGENSRRPQFGMYTSRTPYPGMEPSSNNDKELVKTLSRMFFSKSEKDKKYLEQLMKKGKTPVKANMEEFLSGLNNSKHIPDPEDAELITRFEMQQFCPDILITNYSMLEYMLLRPIEQKIWSDTKVWLNSNPENKLLFIIDEAHMYKGSSGGEVALLIRRLFNKLGIDRDKVQFILTTASMPNNSDEDKRSVKEFAFQLTSANEKSTFSFITGTREKIGKNKYIISSDRFLNSSAELFENEETRLDALNCFWNGVESSPAPFTELSEVYYWMYDNIINYNPFTELIKQCRGTAVSLVELAASCFPELGNEDSLKAISVILAIAPLARNSKNAVLFPARMHMLFRGLKGVYACTNPKCQNCHSDKRISIGEVFLNDGHLVCPECGSVVYELYNDRRCGAIFLKGYVNRKELDSDGSAYLWQNSGQLLDADSIFEIHLYIPEEDYIPLNGRGANKVLPCYLDLKSGFISNRDDSKANDPRYRKLFYCEYIDKGRPDVLTFYKCPHCNHALSSTQLTSFSTRGNQSFFNLIKTQFQIQPAIAGKDKQRMPNEGRKVLLFSDSRQRAAKLARDMSDISEIEAARQLFAEAVDCMEQFGGNYSIDQLYSFFCISAQQNNVKLFHDKDKTDFTKHCKEAYGSYELAKRRKVYNPRYTTENASTKMQEFIIRLFCGGYNTLYDSASCWIEPTYDAIDESIDELKKQGIEVLENDFLEFFNAWIMSISDSSTAIGHIIYDDVRKEVRKSYDGYGLKNDWDFSTVIKSVMGWKKDSKEKEIWYRVIGNKFLETSSEPGNDRLYVDLKRIRPRFDSSHKWFRCEKCTEVTPFLLKGKCNCCGSDKVHEFDDSDYDAISFWSNPIKEAVYDHKPIQVIDTEEHTAQLSHKDQRDDMCSKTEIYELRFQDIVQEDETPVDILSSTTTMEVGIDIGDLVAVGLRNIPPMRENYQQRAGRAGRRGSSLSTIITFCEDGPHDTLYFKDPVSMFRGDPRRPWIDVHSEKLISRHINMIILQDFIATQHSSLDKQSASEFVEEMYDNCIEYIKKYSIKNNSVLIPDDSCIELKSIKEVLCNSINELKAKIEKHPELYEIDNGYFVSKKSMLDALYEEGIIPTYSFPKNVVSTYISDQDNKIKYQVERGLDIAINEYAPGRGIVVDKKTYQIGGLYYPGKKNTARSFLDDSNYMKGIISCDCGWFGLADEEKKICPFCGNTSLTREKNMLKPWGFAPRNGIEIQQAQLDEKYSSTIPPLYSTMPDSDDIRPIDNYKNLKLASRTNQRIIMINKGSSSSGFVVCKECGAAMAGDKQDALTNIGRPYRLPYEKRRCNHREIVNVNLGFDFVTDMLVLEIRLDSKKINTKNSLWLSRAAQSLAEALRLMASKELDIEFSELVAGYRFRTNSNGVFLDVYLYDSLSSGAGYSNSISDQIINILEKTRDLLMNCNCENACHNCLKHYRNQFVHHILDRFAALELLKWAKDGKVKDKIDFALQKKYVNSLGSILEYYGIKVHIEDDSLTVLKDDISKKLIIYPEMKYVENDEKAIYVSDAYIKYARPYALRKIVEGLATNS